jgi:hypothetical protein
MSRCRTPLFIPSDDGSSCDPAGPALIAWDGSYEAANAIRSALGMLRLSSDVHILQVDEGKTDGFPSTRLLEYLSRHGIHAELAIESAARFDRDLVPDMLIARAMTVNASYLVMGGYSHSRVGEYLFGGEYLFSNRRPRANFNQPSGDVFFPSRTAPEGRHVKP